MKTGIASFSRLALAGLLLAALAGCGEQALYSNLSERQANEMVAALRAGGLEAQKQVQDGQYAVLTAPGQFAPAMQLLNAQGFPRETFDTMGKVFKREGFVSSPLEERARLQHAMSQEIANTLAQIDGVVTARVHLVVPERNPLADKAAPAAASVFIKHRAGMELTTEVSRIKALVVNSVEGLPYGEIAAITEVASSGSDVPAATTVSPITSSLTPKYFAKVTAEVTSQSAPSTSKPRPAKIRPTCTAQCASQVLSVTNSSAYSCWTARPSLRLWRITKVV